MGVAADGNVGAFVRALKIFNAFAIVPQEIVVAHPM
jgi:hypothetical protein